MASAVDYSRYDYYLSYWIFIWTIIYLFLLWIRKPNPTIAFFIRNCNPTIIMTIALIENVIGWLIIYFKNADKLILFLYLFVIVFVKAIPIYLLLKYTEIRPIPNSIANVFVLFIYWLYLRVNGITVYSLYYNSIDNLMKGNTPFMKKFLYVKSYLTK